jgi:hypothetical protein
LLPYSDLWACHIWSTWGSAAWKGEKFNEFSLQILTTLLQKKKYKKLRR